MKIKFLSAFVVSAIPLAIPFSANAQALLADVATAAETAIAAETPTFVTIGAAIAGLLVTLLVLYLVIGMLRRGA